MIEKTTLDYLSKKLDVPVSMEMPLKAPTTFVVIEKTSGGKSSHICKAAFAIQSYSDSLLEAAKLNESVKNVMQDMDELDNICSVKLNTDYNFTDTVTKRYRYQAIYDIKYY